MAKFSIVVPYYRSAGTVRYTLESIHRAKRGLDCQILLVDDGSDVPFEQEFKGFAFGPDRIIRQPNQGLLFARLRGLEEARGDYTLFLDADDLIGETKLSAAARAFADPEVTVVYSDTAKVELKGRYDDLKPHPEHPTETVTGMAEFFIKVQPPPHSPIFRTSFLKELALNPLLVPLPDYNPIAEIWFYFNAAVKKGRIRRIAGAETICGFHGGERITNCWEKMSVSSLQIEEAFMAACPQTAETQEARRLFGEKAFRRWRAYPFDYPAKYQRRKLQLWRSCPKSRVSELGHGKFRLLAKIVGPVFAARIIRRMQNRTYESVKTLRDKADFLELLVKLPPPEPARGTRALLGH